MARRKTLQRIWRNAMKTHAKDGWEIGYSPENLRKLMAEQMIGATALSRLTDIPVGTINNWLVANLENPRHRDMPLQTWRGILVVLENQPKVSTNEH